MIFEQGTHYGAFLVVSAQGAEIRLYTSVHGAKLRRRDVTWRCLRSKPQLSSKLEICSYRQKTTRTKLFSSNVGHYIFEFLKDNRMLKFIFWNFMV